MAGKDADEVVVGANGSIWVAPVGTAEPADHDNAYPAGWVELGYTSEDGVTLNVGRTMADIPVWQSFFPVRRMVTARDMTAAFVLRQWNKATLVLAFGGGVITHVASSVGPPAVGEHWRYDPPDPSVVDERMLGVDWVDGAKSYRLIVQRGQVAENAETKIARAAAADLPITFGILADDVNETPWYLLTNDPAFT